jgi:hypothetical protein
MDTTAVSPRARWILEVRRAAVLVAAGAALSGPVAMVLVLLVAPQPPWTGVDAFAASYHPVQALPYALGYLLLSGFVLFAAACHAAAATSLRARTSAALVFTSVYAAMVFTNYAIQIGFVPHALEGRPAYLAALTMDNPASFAWVLEMFGYAAMGVATWLLAPAFGGSRRADGIRALLIANAVLSVMGAVAVALFEGWVFSRFGFVSFAGWNALVVVCFVLIATTPGDGTGLIMREDIAEPQARTAPRG